MAWASEEGFAWLARENELDFESAHQWRQRYTTGAIRGMAEAVAQLLSRR